MQFLQFWIVISLKYLCFFQSHSKLISSAITVTPIFSFMGFITLLVIALAVLLELVILFAIVTQVYYFSCSKKNLNLTAAFNYYCCYH